MNRFFSFLSFFLQHINFFLGIQYRYKLLETSTVYFHCLRHCWYHILSIKLKIRDRTTSDETIVVIMCCETPPNKFLKRGRKWWKRIKKCNLNKNSFHSYILLQWNFSRLIIYSFQFTQKNPIILPHLLLSYSSCIQIYLSYSTLLSNAQQLPIEKKNTKKFNPFLFGNILHLEIRTLS